jgi:hypothetical protein
MKLRPPLTSIPAAPGFAGSRGWTRTLEGSVQQLEAEISGLKDRLHDPIVPGPPAAYQAVRKFEPERYSFLLDTEQDGVSSNPVNYVVRDGATYEIPIVIPGPGVFVVTSIKMSIYQQIRIPGTLVPMVLPVVNSMQGFSPFNWTTKFSVFRKQLETSNSTPPLNVMNYFWNILDTKSGRRLSDELMPHTALLPRTQWPNEGYGNYSALADGGMYELDAPWVFERDGQANCLFRPITPILQFDSSLSGASPAVGLGADDRVNGVRYQPVFVSVEMHGYKYVTEQDALKAGALTRLGR